MTLSALGEKLDRGIRRLNQWADRQPTGLRRACAMLIDLPLRVVRHLWRNRRYLTLYKLMNIVVVNVEYLLRRETLVGLPYDIKIEPTNVCNSACRLCPTGMALHGREKGRMPFERFTTIIAQIRRHAYALDLSNWGDPLTAPDIYRMIRCAHEAGMWTYISSNLHAFSAENGDAKKLVESGLDMLNCSLHAATQKTYEIYQPDKTLATTLNKIRAIIDAKKRLNRRRPEIRLFFVVTRYNEHEIDAFQALADDLGCEAMFVPASLNLRFVGRGTHLEDLQWPEDQKARRVAEMKEQWLPRDEKWIAPWYRNGSPCLSPGRQPQSPKLFACDWPWQGTVINWDGAVTACCGVFSPQWQLGNVFQEPLKRIWNNREYRAARRSFRRGGSVSAAGLPCRNCIGVMT